MAHPDENHHPGTVLAGRWKVGSHIASGGFGLVYEAVDLTDGSECAVKILSLAKLSGPNIFEFERDARLLGLLSGCSNVIAILDSGKEQTTATMAHSGAVLPFDINYMVLERADASLAELLVRRHSINWPDRLMLFRGVVKGLHQMHSAQIVNRDTKGANVLVLTEGRTVFSKISDLGRSCDTTQQRAFPLEAYELGRGDLNFAPPEFLWGLGSDNPDQMRRGDLYLLGSVLFEIATGLGLTGTVLSHPVPRAHAIRHLSLAERRADFAGYIADLQRALETAYSLFRAEVEPAIRGEAERLLRQLSAVDPLAREPTSGHQPHGVWDLQWVLRRVDIMSRILRIDARKHAHKPWKVRK